MAHWDIPPSNQVRHNPGSRGCPKIFQFREIIRTLPIFLRAPNSSLALGLHQSKGKQLLLS